MSSNPCLRDEGFTLLEVMIAMTLMMIAFTSIFMTQSATINTSMKAKSLNVVAMLAKNKMIDIEFAIQGKTFDEVKKEDAGSFEAPFTDYRWKRVVKEMKFPNLNMSGGGASKGGESGENSAASLMTKLITNFMSKALREITLTVSFTKGSGEISHSFSTYWVDLNHEFQLSE